MIIMNHHGGVGNSLFVFCLGKILSLELGTELRHGTIRDRAERSASDMAALAELFPAFAELPSDTISRPSTVYTGHDIDLERILRCRAPKDIALGKPGVGMCFFQNYKRYYAPYKTLIRKDWLTVREPYPDQDPEDLVIHLRLGDIARNEQLSKSFPLVPFEYYDYLLQRIKFHRLHLVTTEPDHPLVRCFARFDPVIIHGDQVHDFKSIISFNKIVIPVSTFSWWAAFLSNASEIYFPVFDHGLWWGLPDKPALGTPDLRVHEERYIYFRPPHMLSVGRPPRRFRLRHIWIDRLRRTVSIPLRTAGRLKNRAAGLLRELSS